MAFWGLNADQGYQMGFLIPLQLAPIIPSEVKSLDGILDSLFGTPVPYSVVNSKSYI